MFTTRSVLHCKRCMRHSRCGLRALTDKASNVTAAESGDAETQPWARRVVSGVQPTGTLHVGNYFGAVRRCVRLQDEGEDLTLFIADLHSLTTHQVGTRHHSLINSSSSYP